MLVLYWKISCSLDSLSSATDDATLPLRGERGELENSERTGERGIGESLSRGLYSSSA